MTQKKCPLCNSVFIGDDVICRTCRSANPDFGKEGIPDQGSSDISDIQKLSDGTYQPIKITKRVVSNEVPFPKGKVVIPRNDKRDYTATIIITTPDTLGENFRYCKHRIDETTHGEHRIVVIESHINEKPYNFSRDINIAIRGCPDSDYYIIMNDDIFLETDDWIDEFVKCTKQDKKIGIIGALLYYPGKHMIQHAGGSYDTSVTESWMDRGWMPVKHEYAGVQPSLAPSIHKQRDVPWNTGALLFITKDCVKKIGLLDEKLIGHCDDVEYCYRAWLNGFRVVYYPKVEAIHREAVTRKTVLREVPHFMKEATKHLVTVLTEEDALKVENMVDASNKRHYFKLKERF